MLLMTALDDCAWVLKPTLDPLCPIESPLTPHQLHHHAHDPPRLHTPARSHPRFGLTRPHRAEPRIPLSLPERARTSYRYPCSPRAPPRRSCQSTRDRPEALARRWAGTVAGKERGT